MMRVAAVPERALQGDCHVHAIIKTRVAGTTIDEMVNTTEAARDAELQVRLCAVFLSEAKAKLKNRMESRISWTRSLSR